MLDSYLACTRVPIDSHTFTLSKYPNKNNSETKYNYFLSTQDGRQRLGIAPRTVPHRYVTQSENKMATHAAPLLLLSSEQRPDYEKRVFPLQFYNVYNYLNQR